LFFQRERPYCDHLVRCAAVRAGDQESPGACAGSRAEREPGDLL